MVSLPEGSRFTVWPAEADHEFDLPGLLDADVPEARPGRVVLGFCRRSTTKLFIYACRDRHRHIVLRLPLRPTLKSDLDHLRRVDRYLRALLELENAALVTGTWFEAIETTTDGRYHAARAGTPLGESEGSQFETVSRGHKTLLEVLPILTGRPSAAR